MKKFISVLLSALLITSVICSAPFAVSSATEGSVTVGETSGTTGDCTWTLDDEGTLTISGNGEMDDFSTVYNNSSITTAPWGEGIKSVVIENGVTSIGRYAFYYCKSLTSVTIPDSVTSIGSYAFRRCESLTSITIPDSVTSIGNSAFYECTGLTSVTIPDSVTSIGRSAFYNTAWYKNQPYGLIYAGKVAYEYKGTMPSNTSIVIKEGTKGISGYAFYGCTGLTSVTIPDSVTSIGVRAFFNCSYLTSITIPDSVTSIGGVAFVNTRWYDNQPDGLIYAGKVAYKYKGEMPNNTAIVIKEGTKGISDLAFSGCTGLTSVTIPDSVTSIGDSAFLGCTGLTIYGVKDSYAKTYAEKNNFSFKLIYGKCDNCHEMIFDSETDVIFDATCTEDGQVYWHCGQCGELGEFVLPALGHDYKTVVTPPTCTKDGYTTLTCSRCKDSYVTDEVAATGHDYQSVVTAPTCTKDGYTTHTCSRCKDSYVTDKVAALGHDYHKSAVVSPTCTEKGCTTYTCSRCNQSKNEDFVDALGHDCTITVKKQPTKTQQGVMAVDCQRCGLKKNVALPILSEQDYTLTSTVTCTESGVLTYTLKDTTYGVYSIDEQLPATGHTVVIDPAVEANFYHDGLTEGSHCKNCGKVFVEQKTVHPSGATGDCLWIKRGSVLIIYGSGKMEDYTYNIAAPWRNSDITTVIIDKGVTSIGDYAFFECEQLENVYISETVNSIGKEAFVDSGVTEIYIPSSVTSIGDNGVGYRRLHYYSGDIFDHVSGFTIYGIPNSEAYNYAKSFANKDYITFVSRYTAPAVPSDIVYKCPHCNSILIDEIFIIDSAVNPTCTGTGLSEGSHCANCGQTIVAQNVIPANGHTEVIDKAKPVTCTEPGLTEGKHCSVCNEVFIVQNVIPAKGHTEVIDKAKPATCTENGLTEGKHCSVCNEVFIVQNVIPAKGHVEVIDEAKSPTCTEIGLTKGSHCSVCNKVLTAQEVIPAKGHTEVIDEGKPAACFKSGLTDGSHCSVCGEVIVPQTVIHSLGHKYVVVPGVPATHTSTGLTEGIKCERCGTWVVTQKEIPKLEGDVILGDANGDNTVDVLDAAAIQKHASGKAELNSEQLAAADVNGDGNVDVLDAADIQKYAAGIISEFKKKA